MIETQKGQMMALGYSAQIDVSEAEATIFLLDVNAAGVVVAAQIISSSSSSLE